MNSLMQKLCKVFPKDERAQLIDYTDEEDYPQHSASSQEEGESEESSV